MRQIKLFSILTFFFAILNGSVAWGQSLTEAYVDPAAPTTSDPVTLVANGYTFSSSITFQYSNFLTEGNVIYVNLYFMDEGVGFPGIQPFTEPVALGTFAEGTYDVKINAYLDGNSVSTLATQFTVSGNSNPMINVTHYAVSPAQPMDGDAVSVTVYGYATTTGAWLMDSTHNFDGTTLNVKLNYSDSGWGIPQNTPFSFTFYLGNLPGGFYNASTIAMLWDGFQSGKDTTFEVKSAPGMEYIYFDSLKHSPVSPEDIAPITLKITGYTYNTNVVHDATTYVVNGSTINVKSTFKNDGSAGTPNITPFTLDVPIGTLPAGFYAVVLNGYYLDLYANTLQDTFTVTPALVPNEVHLAPVKILPSATPTPSDFVAIQTPGFTNKPTLTLGNSLYTKNGNAVEIDLYFTYSGPSAPAETPFEPTYYLNQLPVGYYTVKVRAHYNNTIYAQADTFFVVQTVTDIAPTPSFTQTSVGAVYPNPVSETARLPFTLWENGPVFFEVLDAQGRACSASYITEHFSVGSHTLDIDTRALAAGLYTFRLRAAQGVYTGKFVVVK